jgi:hypothetical protein
MNSSESATIVPWFSKSEYPDVLSTMLDASFLPPTHEAWRRGFEERLRALRQRNVAPLVVKIDPRAFRIWCETEDLPCNAESRLEFAELLARLAQQDERDTPLPPEYSLSPAQLSSTVSYSLRTRIPGWPLLDEASS